MARRHADLMNSNKKSGAMQRRFICGWLSTCSMETVILDLSGGDRVRPDAESRMEEFRACAFPIRGGRFRAALFLC